MLFVAEYQCLFFIFSFIWQKGSPVKGAFCIKISGHIFMMSHANGSTRQNNHKKHVTTSRSVKFFTVEQALHCAQSWY